MSLTELKREAVALPENERRELAESDMARRETLRRMSEMDAGKKFPTQNLSAAQVWTKANRDIGRLYLCAVGDSQ
jgi:hypothetical protein